MVSSSFCFYSLLLTHRAREISRRQCVEMKLRISGKVLHCKVPGCREGEGEKWERSDVLETA